jgi:tetratricopeptide (TPR) repeat protein
MRILSILFRWMCLWLLAAGFSCAGPVAGVASPETVQDDAEMDLLRELERQGRREEARAGYMERCEVNSMSLSCYALIRLLFRMGHVQEARERTISYVCGQPDAAMAPVAMRRLVRSYVERKDMESGLAVLRDMERSLTNTPVWDSVVYAQARLWKELGHVDEERRALMRIVKMGRWGSSLWDDSLWRMIRIAGERGETKEEEQLILQLLSARERSRWIGSYATPYDDQALFRLGHLYVEMGKTRQAYQAFRQLSRWETSRLRDDGLLWSARVLEEQGSGERACRILRKLKHRMPDSSSARTAERLMVEWKCR